MFSPTTNSITFSEKEECAFGVIGLRLDQFYKMIQKNADKPYVLPKGTTKWSRPISEIACVADSDRGYMIRTSRRGA